MAFTTMGVYAVLDEFLTYKNKLFPLVHINIVLARPPVPEMFESRLVYTEEMVAAAPLEHELVTVPVPLVI